MRRAGTLLALAAAAGLLAVSAGAKPPHPRRPGVGTANPSALIAVEAQFARAAREKGQWTAFRDFADDDAVMFAPGPVLARDWLKGRKDPAAAVQWQPYQVWMSCDGTLGVTKGAWQQPDGSVGYFTTIWRQQKNGDYRWVLDQGDALAEPLAEPDMLSATVAECPPRRRGPPSDAEKPSRTRLAAAGMDGGGQSDDGTLTWSYHAAIDNGRALTVSLRKGGTMAEALSLSVRGTAQ